MHSQTRYMRMQYGACVPYSTQGNGPYEIDGSCYTSGDVRLSKDCVVVSDCPAYMMYVAYAKP